ncbi:GNAT family N-acetyltransferase [Leekyejoonella antrihumi]|uniref:GNAT family N-acetyltransferase n=1 Tax=Leekyejoonella antrihumi TaxID=1660198 RepID=UPI0016446F22|nr:GNAT family N-acetyltransferase [Leekyejoonella antrihumi]
MSPVIRAARLEDVPVLAKIYGHAVRESVATFDVTDPPLSYWRERLSSAERGDHLVVVERDGTVAGYACSSRFRPRPAYARTRETSVYLLPDAVGQGLGSLAYSHLLELLRADRMHSAVAVVAEPNPASVSLHESLGFELVGTLREVGRKFDQWVDTRWYQLRLEP